MSFWNKPHNPPGRGPHQCSHPKHWWPCAATRGRGTSASCATLWSAPCCYPGWSYWTRAPAGRAAANYRLPENSGAELTQYPPRPGQRSGHPRAAATSRRSRGVRRKPEPRCQTPRNFAPHARDLAQRLRRASASQSLSLSALRNMRSSPLRMLRNRVTPACQTAPNSRAASLGTVIARSRLVTQRAEDRAGWRKLGFRLRFGLRAGRACKSKLASRSRKAGDVAQAGRDALSQRERRAPLLEAVSDT